MKKLQEIFVKILSVLSIILVLSFILMPLNIMLYYGFRPSVIHSPAHNNPFSIGIGAIWLIHLVIGFLAGMALGKKYFWLTGIMGLFCAAIITGVSFAYFSWRTSLISIEVIIPLIAGILPTMKLYDYLIKRMGIKVHIEPGQQKQQSKQ